MYKIENVLLIDDDTITNFLNLRLLKKLNIAGSIMTANNGYEGLEYVHEFCRNFKYGYHFIFLDIKMPVMDGVEFLQEFNMLNLPNKENITIIMLSTSSNEHDIKEVEKYKVLEFLIKPLTEEKILKVLEHWKAYQEYKFC
jgi:response regulator of citrate/malate metabolism